MWSDNETTVDLIGFKVHSDLIKKVITSSDILPVVIGVFGDWGGGKSSIMKMLQKSFESDAKTLCLYFNGWTFEDYEDAKTALISSILVGIGENKKLHNKIIDDVVSLLRRVKWMQVAKIGIQHIGVPLALGAITGGVGAIPGIINSLVSLSNKEKDEKKKDGKKEEKNNDNDKNNWLDLIDSNSSKPDILEVRKFREDFEKMLGKTKLDSLVVLIDDLDRCLPERIIDTLEAIKLFVSVPKTAFVIGADPRIVKHAIATRYVSKQLSKNESSQEEMYNLVDDYLEKLIQIPYHLPRLSPTEIETYINLLTCQKFLSSEDFQKTLSYWDQQRSNDFYSACGYEHIKSSLSDPSLINEELEKQLAWSRSIAQAITEGLKGNPRQVKRMLNAMILRRSLAEVAKLSIRDDVLAKLMVLEYISLPLFKQLNDWQTSEKGFPKKIQEFESILQEGKELTDEALGNWKESHVKTWLKIPPFLSEVDLRDYFWLARDKTDSMLIGVQLVAPLIRRIFTQLLTGDNGQQHLAVRAIKELNANELDTLLKLIQQNIEHYPDRDEGSSALLFLVDNDIDNSVDVLLQTLENIPPAKIPPKFAFKLNVIKSREPKYKYKIDVLFSNPSISNTAFGRAIASLNNR